MHKASLTKPYGYYQGTIPDRENLFWKIWQEIDLFIDIEKIWKDVLASCVLFSYQQEKLQTVPYLLVYGDNESGKSTVLQVLKYLCYRPMYGVTIPAADLYGFLEDSDGIGCIFEDEIQGIQKDTDKIKIYKAGYKKGAVVPRTIITSFDRTIKYYRTFCFKICASEQLPQVKGFNERFLFLPMVEGFPQKEWADLTKEDINRLQELRDILLKWRMLSKDWELPSFELSIKGRLKELWKPILQITHGLVVYDDLFRFVEEQKKERLGTKQDTLEGHIVKVVIENFNSIANLSNGIPFSTIWESLVADLSGKVDEKKPNIMDTSEFFNVSKNKVGYRLREVLSGQSKAIKDGNMVLKAYFFDFEKLRRVAKKYGYEVTKLLSKPSSEDMQSPESMGKEKKTNGNNVEKNGNAQGELSYLSNSVTKTEGTSPSKDRVLHYRRLAPNENKKCEGEGKGGPCPHLAQYEFSSSDNPEKLVYCESHFQTIRKSCSENGYVLSLNLPGRLANEGI